MSQTHFQCVAPATSLAAAGQLHHTIVMLQGLLTLQEKSSDFAGKVFAGSLGL